jgi:hypothetical protein
VVLQENQTVRFEQMDHIHYNAQMIPNIGNIALWMMFPTIIENAMERLNLICRATIVF